MARSKQAIINEMRDEITRLKTRKKDTKDVKQILIASMLTRKHLDACKRDGQTIKKTRIDSLLNYCDTVDLLCKRILEG